MGTFVNGLVTSFKAELGEGIHALSTDTLRLALYADTATLTRETTAYAAGDEVVGAGYTAGGEALALAAGYPLTNAYGQREYRFDPVTWINATFTARAALLYNASKSNRAIRVIDFGQNRPVTLSNFIVRQVSNLPALICISSG